MNKRPPLVLSLPRHSIIVLLLWIGTIAQAADVTWDGSSNSNWATGTNWNNGSGPAEGDVAFIHTGNVVLSSGAPPNLRALRLLGGSLTFSGGTFKATFNSSWDSHVEGTLRHTGTDADFNELEIGRTQGDNGRYLLSGGDLNIARGLKGYSLYLGANKSDVHAGTGTIEISGGSFITRAGVKLGDAAKTGRGTFAVLGSATAQIGIGSSKGDTDGSWHQHAASTLRVGIDAGGVTTIFLDDSSTGTQGTSATFERGSILDVDYEGNGSGGGTWTVLEVENGDITDRGLAFAAGVDRDIWSFNIDNSGPNGLLTVTAAGEPTGLPLVVGDTRKQMMRYGVDYERLWFWTTSMNASEKDMVARWSVLDCDVDYVRVAINAKYELTEGVYDMSAYTKKILPMMKDMQDANPDIKFFGSPRPLNEAISGARWQPYPYWITGDPGNGSSFDFDHRKCAEYLVRYVQLMKREGFKISYLDVTNEWNFVTPTDVREISRYMKSQLGADMPLLIAPSTWSYAQGRSWLSGANTNSKRDAIDIAASHNTDKTGTAEDFAERAAQVLGPDTEVWNTELHGWKGTSPSDEIPSSSFMWETIRAGFTGISGWLAIGTTNQKHCYILNPNGNPTRNVKYFIFKKLTTTSNYGHALDINQPTAFTSTAALIKGNLMTVWVLNNSSNSVPIQILPTGRTLSESRVKRTRWNENLSLEGVSDQVPVTTNTKVASTISGRSLYCFEILLEPKNLPFAKIEAEDFASKSGMFLQTSQDVGGTQNLGNINHGTWARYDGLTLGEDAVMRFRVARPEGRKDGWIEVREGNPTGTLLGRVAVPETGGWQTYETIETTLNPATGDEPIYLTFVEVGSSARSALFNLNWLAIPMPRAPTGLTATASSSSRISLRWDAVPGATGYRVKRATRPTGPFFTITSGLNATTFSNSALASGATYYYIVSSEFGESTSPDSAAVQATTMPGRPGGVSARASSATSIDLSWNPVNGALGYNVKRAPTSDGPYTTIEFGLDATSYRDEDLSPGGRYFYVVTAVNSGGESANSSATTALTPPSTPTGFRIVATGPAHLDFTWDQALGALAYNLKRATTSGGPYTNIALGLNGTTFRDPDLAPGLQYYYVVTAVNAGGESAPSSEILAQTSLGSPTGLTATAASATQIRLTWNPVAGALAYNLSRSTNNDGPFAPLATGLTATNHRDTGLAKGKRYFYVVSAVSNGGEGLVSSPVSALTLPPRPSGLTAVAASATQIQLSWHAVSGTAYHLKRSTLSGGPYATVALELNETSYRDTGLSKGVRYYYVVAATNSSGEGTNSTQTSALTLPGRPSGLKAMTSDATSIDLTWDPTSGAESYNLKRSTTSGGPYTTVASGLSAPSHQDAALTPGTRYYYVVSAVNMSGQGVHSTQTSALLSNPITENELLIEGLGLSSSPGEPREFSFSLPNSVRGHRYQVETSATMKEGSWNPVGDALEGIDGKLLVRVPLELTDHQRFFRVVVRQH